MYIDYFKTKRWKIFLLTLLGLILALIAMAIYSSTHVIIHIINTKTENVEICLIDLETNKEYNRSINGLTSKSFGFHEGKYDIFIFDKNKKEIKTFKNNDLKINGSKEIFIDTSDNNMYYFFEITNFYGIRLNKHYFTQMDSSKIMEVNTEKHMIFINQFDKIPNAIHEYERVILLFPFNKNELGKMSEEQINTMLENFVTESLKSRIFNFWKDGIRIKL